MSKPTSIYSSTPSDVYLDAKDHDRDYNMNDAMFSKTNKVMCSLKGNKLIMFLMLMEMLTKPTITIKELKTLVIEVKDKCEILERKVLYEESCNDELCLMIGANIDMHTKELASLKKTKSSHKVLMNYKNKLEDCHATLSKDCELLHLSLKTKEEKLIVLTKKFDELKSTYHDTLGKSYSSPIMNVDSCAKNPNCDLAIVNEDNRLLKSQFEKGLVSCA